MTAPIRIVVVDDEVRQMQAICNTLQDHGHKVSGYSSAADALKAIQPGQYEVLLTDLLMPEMDGIAFLKAVQQRDADLVGILMTGAGSISTAIEAMKVGAFDYLLKPFSFGALQPVISRAQSMRSLRLENAKLHDGMRERTIELEIANRKLEALSNSVANRLEGLLNRLKVGVFRSTLDGQLLSANPAFFHIFAIPQSVEISSLDLRDLYVDRQDRLRLIERLEKEGQVQDYQIYQRRMDGRNIWASVTKAVFTDGEGHRFIDGMVEDITDRKEGERALIAKSEALAKSNAELEHFASIASHDLQEPLRMISTYTDIIEQRYSSLFDEKAKEYFARILNGTHRMRSLIHAILAYSQVDKLPPKFELVAAQDAIQDALEHLEIQITAKNADITVATDLPTLLADRIRLTQLFQNLVSNALKFSAADRTPQVRINSKSVEEDWVFTVSDNGIGIPLASQERVFRIFQRLHALDSYPGSGIGLASCKKIVEQHGGRLWVESIPDVGSTFAFAIPKRRLEQ